jgi:hypothetical protein
VSLRVVGIRDEGADARGEFVTGDGASDRCEEREAQGELRFIERFAPGDDRGPRSRA